MITIPLTQGRFTVVSNEDYEWLSQDSWHFVLHRIHPRAEGGSGNRNRKMMHRQIAERVLGKPLPPGAEVHHADENTLNNQRSNLVICENSSYHKLLHRRIKAVKACGHLDWRKCRYCGEYDSPENLSIPSDGYNPYHKRCAAQYRREYRDRLFT